MFGAKRRSSYVFLAASSWSRILIHLERPGLHRKVCSQTILFLNICAYLKIDPTVRVAIFSSLIAYELLLTGKEDLKILISNRMIRIISSDQSSSTSVKTILQIPYSDLYYCKFVENKSAVNETKHYIELTKRVDGASPGQVVLKRPQVRCNDEFVAQKVGIHVFNSTTLSFSVGVIYLGNSLTPYN